jgi:hypothetical protein
MLGEFLLFLGLTAFRTMDSTAIGMNAEYQRCIRASAVPNSPLLSAVAMFGVLRANSSRMRSGRRLHTHGR